MINLLSLREAYVVSHKLNHTTMADTTNPEISLPGFAPIKADALSELLNTIHDIAQGLAYMEAADLHALDTVNRSYVGFAFNLATTRAHKDLFDIMMKIRRLREVKQG